jgi:hypothetical protein
MSITAPPGPGDDVPASAASNEMLAGFIVWLARRRLRVGRRREPHHEVERFLRWQTGPGQSRGGATVYLQQLRQAGHSEAELTGEVGAQPPERPLVAGDPSDSHIRSRCVPSCRRQSPMPIAGGGWPIGPSPHDTQRARATRPLRGQSVCGS